MAHGLFTSCMHINRLLRITKTTYFEGLRSRDDDSAPSLLFVCESNSNGCGYVGKIWAAVANGNSSKRFNVNGPAVWIREGRAS